MPKHKTSQRHKARHIATLFDKEFKIDCDGKLFCTYCGVIVNCTKKYYVENHRKTKKTSKFDEINDDNRGIFAFNSFYLIFIQI